jgi:nitric oxide reductase subunit B
MRVVGDTIFSIGALVLGWFVLGLGTGHSFDRGAEVREGEADVHQLPQAALGD